MADGKKNPFGDKQAQPFGKPADGKKDSTKKPAMTKGAKRAKGGM